MSFVIENASIVVAAQMHNPSILQPHFLHAKEVIPKDWKWDEARVTITPPLSQIVFKEGFAITAELQKLIFQENTTERIPGQTLLGKIALNFVTLLPHTPYTGVGINFSGHIERSNTSDAANYILTKFLKPGVWTKYSEAPPAIGLKFAFILANSKCTVGIEPGEIIEVTKPNRKLPVIFVNANYHRESDPTNSKWLPAAIENWKDDYRHFLKIVDDLLFSD